MWLTSPGQRAVNTLRINILYQIDNNRLAKVRLFFELANKIEYFFRIGAGRILHSDSAIRRLKGWRMEEKAVYRPFVCRDRP